MVSLLKIISQDLTKHRIKLSLKILEFNYIFSQEKVGMNLWCISR